VSQDTGKINSRSEKLSAHPFINAYAKIGAKAASGVRNTANLIAIPVL